MRAHFRLSDNPDDRQDSDCDNQQGGRRTYIATRGSFEEGARWSAACTFRCFVRHCRINPACTNPMEARGISDDQGSV
jgi:hypothetical protein